MFFSLDGIDGTGISTQLRLFCSALREQGFEVVECRDPGSTKLGERIRELLLTNDDSTAIGSRSEMLLYMAARAQLVDEVISPAISAGKVVVSDRYLMANIVYQGHAGGLDPEQIRSGGAVAPGGIMPDCTFLLDRAPDIAEGRMDRPLDRMESRGAEYRARLREGFLKEAAAAGARVFVIDAARPVEAVQADIWRIAEGELGRLGTAGRG